MAFFIAFHAFLMRVCFVRAYLACSTVPMRRKGVFSVPLGYKNGFCATDDEKKAVKIHEMNYFYYFCIIKR